MSKHALVTGVTGQDGYYLTEHLISLGYNVSVFIRRTSKQPELPCGIYRVYHGSLESYESIIAMMLDHHFDEIYHLAAQSFVQESFHDPHTTLDINVGGTLRLLEAITNYQPDAKFYFAASSEMFGNQPAPQNESTPFMPRSPYGVSKLAGYQMTKVYREAYGIFACNGILFNHESPRRGLEFVTQKICQGAKNIVNGTQTSLVLGALNAKRDWGHAKDYVKAMHLMLQQPEPDDYVIATGETHTVGEFLHKVFEIAGLSIEDYVRFDPTFARPAEVFELCGDWAKAREKLGWSPTYTFDSLIEDMMK